MDKLNKQHCERALKHMLDLDLIKFDQAPYWYPLDDQTRLYVFPDHVEFQTRKQTVQIQVKQLEAV